MSLAKSYRSPHQVIHKEVIENQEKSIRWMKATFPLKVNEGSMTSWAAEHKLAEAEYILSLLKQTDPAKQGNLFTNHKMKNNERH